MGDRDLLVGIYERISKLENLNERLIRIESNVENLSKRLESMEKKLEDTKDRVGKIERKPAELVMRYLGAAAISAIGVIVGYVARQMLGS